MSLEISSAQTFSFSKGNVTTFPTSQKCKNFNFSLFTVLAEMLYLQKYLTNFQKLFFRNVTTFPIATIQLFQHPENVKFQFLALHSPGRNAISPEVFNAFSKSFFSLKEEEAGYYGWKFQVHRHFHFPIATLQLFRHPRKCKNFNFPLYTVPAEMPYLQKYLTNFQKHFFGWKKRKLATVVENLKYTDVFVLL